MMYQNMALTTQQMVALLLLATFLIAVIIVNGIRKEKETSAKRWKDLMKDKPYDDPARVALRQAGYPVD